MTPAPLPGADAVEYYAAGAPVFQYVQPDERLRFPTPADVVAGAVLYP